MRLLAFPVMTALLIAPAFAQTTPAPAPQRPTIDTNRIVAGINQQLAQFRTVMGPVALGGSGGISPTLWLQNEGTSARSVSAELLDVSTGRVLASWSSPSIPAKGAISVQTAAINTGIVPPRPSQALLRFANAPGIRAQYVLFPGGNRAPNNLSTCNAPATPGRVLGPIPAGPSVFSPPLFVLIAPQGRTASFEASFHDAATGRQLGTVPKIDVAAGGVVTRSLTSLLSDARVSGATNVTLSIEKVFGGTLAYLFLGGDGVASDVTDSCLLGVQPVSLPTPAPRPATPTR